MRKLVLVYANQQYTMTIPSVIENIEPLVSKCDALTEIVMDGLETIYKLVGVSKHMRNMLQWYKSDIGKYINHLLLPHSDEFMEETVVLDFALSDIAHRLSKEGGFANEFNYVRVSIVPHVE